MQGVARKSVFAGVLVFCVCFMLILGIILYLVLRKDTNTPATTFPAVLRAPTFSVLYYTSSPPLGFTINESTISYTDEVLFIPVTSKDGRQLVITQQALPDDFSQSKSVVGDEKITGANGQAAISHTQGHTTATMITKDRKTLVIINDTAGVGSDAVKDLLRSLKPLP
jgi:hypothetical protein